MPSQVSERPIFYNLSDICPICDVRNRSFDGLKLLKRDALASVFQAPKSMFFLLSHWAVNTNGRLSFSYFFTQFWTSGVLRGCEGVWFFCGSEYYECFYNNSCDMFIAVPLPVLRGWHWVVLGDPGGWQKRIPFWPCSICRLPASRT